MQTQSDRQTARQNRKTKERRTQMHHQLARKARLLARQTNKQAETLLARQQLVRTQTNAGTDKQREKHEMEGRPEVVPVHPDGGVLAGSDEGLQVM